MKLKDRGRQGPNVRSQPALRGDRPNWQPTLNSAYMCLNLGSCLSKVSHFTHLTAFWGSLFAEVATATYTYAYGVCQTIALV